MSTLAVAPLPAQEVLMAAEAERLASAGNFRAAITLAVEANRRCRMPELERRLVSWRRDAFPGVEVSGAPDQWPPRFDDPFPGLRGLPKIAASELTVEIMGGAFQHHGALWVHGLFPPDQADSLRSGIDRAFAARDAFHAGTPAEETNPWYSRAEVHTRVGLARGWVEEGGGVWTADSPRMLFELLEAFEKYGIIDIISGYLGERPALSVGKSTLRRVPHTTHSDWHQDGAFLGADIRTVNVWLALSDCGVDAPGLDIVAQRLPHIVETGSHGALFDWSVGPKMVDLLEQGGAPVVSPVFRPGDAMLFDQLMLHRTGIRPHMTKSRWAIESWFFAPSTYPIDQGPLVI